MIENARRGARDGEAMEPGHGEEIEGHSASHTGAEGDFGMDRALRRQSILRRGGREVQSDVVT